MTKRINGRIMSINERLFVFGLVALAVAALVAFLPGFAVRQPELIPVSHAAEGSVEKPKDSADELPPLVVDKTAPLLLEEPSDKKDKKFLRINQSCFVCHDNYKDEYLMLVHAKEEIGCVDCHGESVAHRNDEDNITPPDLMYPLDEIDDACQECHDTHDAPADMIIARWQARCPEKKDVEKIACTDCHGRHRLKARTVRWDKSTGELLVERPKSKVTGDDG
jgi:hypothetical protein